MKIKVQEEFNIFELFVYDNEMSHGIDLYRLAEAINNLLYRWTVSPPESLERFILFSSDEEEYFMERYYNVQQVKNELPDDAINQLEDINKMEFDLSPRFIKNDISDF
jgi:hypothetical protein